MYGRSRTPDATATWPAKRKLDPTKMSWLGDPGASSMAEVWRRLAGDDDRLNEALFATDDIEPWRIAITSLLCWVVTSLAVAAGIGGGGLLVPLYAFVLGLGPQNAVPVSKATIFGVALGNVFFIARERHPNADRPLIDYSTAVFMQGGELMGVVIGVLVRAAPPRRSVRPLTLSLEAPAPCASARAGAVAASPLRAAPPSAAQGHPPPPRPRPAPTPATLRFRS